MSTTVSPKDAMSAATFNQLPSLHEAKNLLAKLDKDIIENRIRPFFYDNKMEERFGIQLAHRHASLIDGEKMVKDNNTVSPWPIELGKTKPASWWICDGEARTVEECSEDNMLSPEDISFFEAFSAFAQAESMNGLWMLVPHPGLDFEGTVESTHERTNINIPMRDVRNPDPIACLTDSVRSFPQALRLLQLPGSSMKSSTSADAGARAIVAQRLTTMAVTSTPSRSAHPFRYSCAFVISHQAKHKLDILLAPDMFVDTR